MNIDFKNFRFLMGSLFMGAALSACSEQEFSGNNAKCTTEGTANVNLISKEVENGIEGNFILYKIKLENICDSELNKKSAILFDINGELTSTASKIPIEYKIISGSKTITSGELVTVEGEDLFGNTGVNYLHNKTDNEIAYSIAKSGVDLRIELGGVLYMPQDSDGKFKEGEIFLDTFLKFGSAAVVNTQVKFAN